MSDLPSPSDLLGIPKFSQWNEGQEDTFKSLMDWFYSPARFIGVAAPTGTGKTLATLLLAKMSDARTVILTSTKGLQQQYLDDAKLLGAVNVQGQNNFPCALVPYLKADEAPCHEGMPCPHPRAGTCQYRAQLQKALNAKIVITNYAYYLAQTRFSTGLGEIGLLACDEGHTAFSAMENHLTIWLSKMDVESQGLSFPILPAIPEPVKKSRSKKAVATGESDTPEPPDIWGIWKAWAGCSLPTIESTVSRLDKEIHDIRSSSGQPPASMSKAYRTAKSLFARLSALYNAQGDWVIQKTIHGYQFTPRWVNPYATTLFGTVPKVVLMSAILSQKTCDYLGVDSGANRAWLEVGSYFPPENTPIYHVPTARINYRTDDYGTTIWLSRIDQIISRRLDRKGIIFTVSYDRARLLLANSRYKDIMMTHSTSDVAWVVQKFKEASAPRVLVSPSVTTGWDFPGNGKPQYIIIGKIPYPDTKDPVLQARHADDKDWSSFLAMDTLIQESGRMTRGAEDKTEVFLVDDAAVWFFGKYRQFAPKWFLARYRGSLTCVIDPIFKLDKE